MQPEQRQKDQHNSDSDDKVKQEQEEESQGRDYYLVNQKSSSQSQRQRDGQKTTKKKGNNQEKKRKKKKKGKQAPFWGFSQYKRYTVKPVDPSVPKRKIIRKPIIKGQRVGGLHISDIQRVIQENKQCSGHEVGRYKLREQKKKIIQDISEKQQQEQSSEQNLKGQQQYGEQKKAQRGQQSKHTQNKNNSQKLRPSKKQEQSSSQLRGAIDKIRKLTKLNKNLQDKLLKNRQYCKKLEQNVARLQQQSFDKSQKIQHQVKEIYKLRIKIMQVALQEKDKEINFLLQKQATQKENENNNEIYDKKEINYQQNMEQTEMKNKQPNITSVSSTQKKPLYPIFGSVESFMRKSPNSSLEKINSSVIPNGSKPNGYVTKQKYNSAKKDDKLLVKKQQIKNAQNNKKKEESNKNMTNLGKIHFKQSNS